MFCPNCGAQNQDTATACAKCGFTLKAASAAPKFKGTMLMMNAPPSVPRPGGASAPAPGAPTPPRQAPAVPNTQPPAPAAAAAAPRPKLKGTMIGVAPPSLGSNTPAFGAVPTPAAAAPAPAAFSTTARSPSPPPPPVEPASAVNPLGGTVVADAGAFGGTFPGAGPAAQQVPPPPAAIAGGFAGGQTEAFGAPPPGFGTQPAGFGPPPAGFGAQQSGHDASGDPNALPVHQPAPMQYGSDEPLPPIPGTVGGPNAIVTVLLIVLTCGLYGIYLLIKGRRSASS